jgi:CelD/BcsL family acetyltransferase involved in cellulose biosynthesis
MSDLPRVAVARDRDTLAGLVAQWDDLARHALEPNPLYEHWMLLPALPQVNEGFRCVLVWTADRLDGLFPLEPSQRVKGFPWAGYRSWCHRSWMLGTPLVRAGAAPAVLAALFDWLAAEESAFAEFRYLCCDGAFHGALADALRERQAMVVPTESFTRGLLLKRASADAYIEAALSPESRKSLRRKEQRLGERGRVAHVVLQPGDDAERWIDEFLRLEASGWKGKLGGALACSKTNRHFAFEALSAAFRRGRLQMVGIDVDGKPVSRCCNLLAGEGAYAYRCAYDEDYAYYSPGVIAELDTVRAFHALPEAQWMDSLTDPDNATPNRLWKDRRTIETLLVGTGVWGEFWTSMLPLMRWAKRRMARLVTAAASSDP